MCFCVELTSSDAYTGSLLDKHLYKSYQTVLKDRETQEVQSKMSYVTFKCYEEEYRVHPQ